MNGAEALAFLDVGPFKRILSNRLEELQGVIDINDPAEQLVRESGLSQRMIQRIMKGQEKISFDNADKVVTNILGPMAWHEDRELNAIYESVDLTLLDWSFPVSENVREELREVAVQTIEELGTVRAAKKLGISAATASRYAREAARA